MKKKILFTTIMVAVICLLAFGIMSVFADTYDDYSTGTYGDFEYSVYDGRVSILKCTSTAATIEIPKTINGYPVTIVYSSAFYDCKSLTNIVFPDTIEEIGSHAFYGCTALEKIILPEGVERIGLGAFQNCSSLKTITIPGSVTSIGDIAFGECIELMEITIPNSITSIGENLFWRCTGLTEIIIPGSVTSIGTAAFGGCAGLTEITIPDSVTSIGASAFDGCAGLVDITVGKGVTRIGYSAFYGCYELTNVYIADLESWCKIDCDNFFNSSPLEYAENLYLNNELVRNITIPYGVTSIGNKAFYSCASLTSITIPDSVTSIGDSAFYKCSAITDVYYNGLEEEWANVDINMGNDSLTKATIHFATETSLTPAEKLCKLINEQTANSCEVDIDTQTVTLLSDILLSETIEIPIGGEIILDIDEFNILGANEADALYIPTEANLKIVGTGTIRGGNTVDEQYNYVGSAVSNDGILRISGPTLVGGDEREMFCYAAPGVRGWGTTYFIEGSIQAGKGNYSDYVYYTKGSYTIVLESDDGENYTVAKQEWGSNKKYIKAVLIPQGLSALEELAAVLNIIQPGTCSVASSKLTLNKDFSCPYSIEIPTGDAIILDFNGHTVTTDDFFMPFIIPEQAKITFKGNGLLTNKEQSSGTASGMGGGAAVISNEGKLTINGITVIGVGLCGISNDGELTVYSGKITVGDYDSGKDAIVNSGNIEVFGGDIIGGNATRDGKSGGDGISSMSGVASGDGTYPIKLYGGILCGGKGFGNGENGRAISTSFNIGEACIAYESDDGENYFETDDTRSYMRYLKTVNINDNPEIEDGNLGDLGTPSAKNTINTNKVTFDGGKVTFDIVLTSNETITGNVYVAVYEGKRLSLIKPYTAETEIPVSIECTNGQNIKVFWWNANLTPISLPTEVKFE